MIVRFVGGPLDGQIWDPEKYRGLAQVFPVQTQSGMETFLTIPSPEHFERFRQGEDADCPLHLYARVAIPGGYELRYDEDAAMLSAAQADANRSLSEAEMALKHRFSLKADELEERVRGTPITSDTDILLIRYYEDENGNRVGRDSISLVPLTKVSFPGDQDAAREFAAKMHLDGILAGIDSNVRNAPVGFRKDATGRMLRYADFDIEFLQ